MIPVDMQDEMIAKCGGLADSIDRMKITGSMQIQNLDVNIMRKSGRSAVEWASISSNHWISGPLDHESEFFVGAHKFQFFIDISGKVAERSLRVLDTNTHAQIIWTMCHYLGFSGAMVDDRGIATLAAMDWKVDVDDAGSIIGVRQEAAEIS